MAIDGYITLTLEAFPEGRQFVSRCRELGVASCGDSIGMAIDSLTDAITTYLNAIEELGERERIFAEKGIEVVGSKPRRPIAIDGSKLPANAFAGTVVFPLRRAA